MSERLDLSGVEHTPCLPLAEVAERLGYHGSPGLRRLRRLLKQREARLAETILVRVGGEGVGARYLVSMSVLEQHCPEFFRHREGVVALLQSKLEGIEETLQDLRANDQLLGVKIARVAATRAA